MNFTILSNPTQGNNLTVLCDFEDGNSEFNAGKIYYNGDDYPFIPVIQLDLKNSKKLLCAFLYIKMKKNIWTLCSCLNFLSTID